MNDIKMMLGKRAAQYYLFLTWCIISPILMIVKVHDFTKFNSLFSVCKLLDSHRNKINQCKTN